MENIILSEKQKEEESSVFSNIVVAKKSSDWVKNELLVAIVDVEKTEFLDNLNKVDICGKKLVEWMEFSMAGLDCNPVIDGSDREVIQSLKNICQGKKYIFLTYSTLPYLRKSTVIDLVSYFDEKHLSVMQLPKGIIVATDFLDRLEGLYALNKKNFEGIDFDEIKNSDDISKYFELMNKKIIEYHKNNGVILIGEKNIFIDADVEIDRGVIIYPDNILRGHTSICKNVVLENGNIIEDSIIEDGSKIICSFVKKSRICAGKVVGPCEKIINESV